MSAQIPPTLLAELIAAKFSHDVAGPVSAISNGIELMTENAEDASMQAEAAELLRMSATELRSRMLLFRQVYGVIIGGGQEGISEIEATLKAYFHYLKTDCSVVPSAYGADVTALNFHGRRFVLNAVLLVAGMLIGKATIRLSIGQKDGTVTIHIAATALKTRQDTDLAAMLVNRFDTTQLSVKNIQQYMTFQFAKEIQANLQLKQHEASIELVAECTHKAIY